MWILHLLIKNNKQQKGKKQDIQKKKKKNYWGQKSLVLEKNPQTLQFYMEFAFIVSLKMLYVLFTINFFNNNR